MSNKFKTAFVCTSCGSIHAKWQGQCKECGLWNTLAEEKIIRKSKTTAKAAKIKPVAISEISIEEYSGFISGIGEFDRVLGGSILPGSCALLAGEPGVGKSTLILQAASAYSNNGRTVLYVTGEESLSQIKIRAKRLSAEGDTLMVVSLTDLEKIIAAIESNRYDIVIIDSIQTVTCDYFDSPPGTIGQIRESAGRLIEQAKKNNFALFLVGHVTKEGLVAGPKVLEHMVDTVLQFEGDSRHLYRLLRPSKNRFGSTYELGVFEMSSAGLQEVENPSILFLSDFKGGDRTGAVVTASCEGNRPILIEIQALVSPSTYGTPQRVAGGIDNKRLSLLLAILEKRIGIPMGNNDVFISVAGGLRLTEPSFDLAVLTAIVSSLKNAPVDSGTVIAGEVGLSGEVRPVGMVERRISEAAKLGFGKMILPSFNTKNLKMDNFEIKGVSTLEESFELLF
jgi:DNA repair protein RadA/Sms